MLTIDLSGKTALVVGGSRGIGAGITCALCRAGARVVFTYSGRDARSRQAAAALADELRQQKGWAMPLMLAATDAAGMQAAAERIATEQGRIDILVFNVGSNIERQGHELTESEWREGLSLNLDSAFFAVRAVLPHMLKAQSGRIILIGSSAVCNGGGGALDYAAGKGGLAGMMAYLTRVYARQGILTNIIHPAAIDTELLRERYPGETERQKLAAQIPAGRLGRPDDIAGLAAYLASSWGDYICGQAFLVDGGRTLFR
jgi:NAD(P)-dependent dehydrogenase (short-subunit alcohol dehydrogenase family)